MKQLYLGFIFLYVQCVYASQSNDPLIQSQQSMDQVHVQREVYQEFDIQKKLIDELVHKNSFRKAKEIVTFSLDQQQQLTHAALCIEQAKNAEKNNIAQIIEHLKQVQQDVLSDTLLAHDIARLRAQVLACNAPFSPKIMGALSGLYNAKSGLHKFVSMTPDQQLSYLGSVQESGQLYKIDSVVQPSGQFVTDYYGNVLHGLGYQTQVMRPLQTVQEVSEYWNHIVDQHKQNVEGVFQAELEILLQQLKQAQKQLDDVLEQKELLENYMQQYQGLLSVIDTKLLLYKQQCTMNHLRRKDHNLQRQVSILSKKDCEQQKALHLLQQKVVQLDQQLQEQSLSGITTSDSTISSDRSGNEFDSSLSFPSSHISFEQEDKGEEIYNDTLVKISDVQAVTRLQAFVRMNHAQAQVKKLRKEQQEYQAAIKINSLIRRFLAQQKVHELKLQQLQKQQQVNAVKIDDEQYEDKHTVIEAIPPVVVTKKVSQVIQRKKQQKNKKSKLVTKLSVEDQFDTSEVQALFDFMQTGKMMYNLEQKVPAGMQDGVQDIIQLVEEYAVLLYGMKESDLSSVLQRLVYLYGRLHVHHENLIHQPYTIKYFLDHKKPELSCLIKQQIEKLRSACAGFSFEVLLRERKSIDKEIDFIEQTRGQALGYSNQEQDIVFPKLQKAADAAKLKLDAVERALNMIRIVSVIDEMHEAGGMLDLETIADARKQEIIEFQNQYRNLFDEKLQDILSKICSKADEVKNASVDDQKNNLERRLNLYLYALGIDEKICPGMSREYMYYLLPLAQGLKNSGLQQAGIEKYIHDLEFRWFHDLLLPQKAGISIKLQEQQIIGLVAIKSWLIKALCGVSVYKSGMMLHQQSFEKSKSEKMITFDEFMKQKGGVAKKKR